MCWLEVHWPVTGERQRFPGLPVNRLVRVTEGAPEVDALKLTGTPFRR